METDINNSTLNNSQIMRDFNTVSYNSKIKNFKQLPKWVYWVWIIAIISIGLSIISIFFRVSPYTNLNVEIVSIGIVLMFLKSSFIFCATFGATFYRNTPHLFRIFR